MTPIKPQICFC